MANGSGGQGPESNNAAPGDVDHQAPGARIAYLTNAYPKVSHSFIRREIRALEDLGASVLRISVRRTTETLPDPDDRDEAAKTIALIASAGSVGNLALAAARRLLRSPAAFMKTAALALSSARGSAVGYLRHLAYLAEACAIADLLAKRRVQHLHAHFGTNPATVARLVKSLSGIPYSFTVHGPDEFDDPRGLRLGDKIADAAFTVAISNYGRAQLMRWSEVRDWDRIKVVRCGVDQKFLEPLGAEPASGRGFLTVARLGTQKGVPILLEAAALVRSRGYPIQLKTIGDGELRPLVERRIETLNLHDSVELLGWQGSDRVRQEMEACRAFVLPSFAEGLPVVIMEALALGKPVIATAIAGIPELVDQECGWVVSPGAAEELADAMIAAMDAAAESMAKKGEIGRERVLQSHNARSNARLLLDAFLTDKPTYG